MDFKLNKEQFSFKVSAVSESAIFRDDRVMKKFVIHSPDRNHIKTFNLFTSLPSMEGGPLELLEESDGSPDPRHSGRQCGAEINYYYLQLRLHMPERIRTEN